MSWQRALALSALPGDSAKTVEVAGQTLALFRAGKEVYALQNACIHRGGPLGEGHVEEGLVTCPWHAWQFELKSGKCTTLEGAKQKVFKTKIEKDEIWVDI